jgi:hypothetical protein
MMARHGPQLSCRRRAQETSLDGPRVDSARPGWPRTAAGTAKDCPRARRRRRWSHLSSSRAIRARRKDMERRHLGGGAPPSRRRVSFRRRARATSLNGPRIDSARPRWPRTAAETAALHRCRDEVARGCTRCGRSLAVSPAGDTTRAARHCGGLCALHREGSVICCAKPRRMGRSSSAPTNTSEATYSLRMGRKEPSGVTWTARAPRSVGMRSTAPGPAE